MENEMSDVWFVLYYDNYFNHSLLQISMKIFKIIIQDDNSNELWNGYFNEAGISDLFSSKSAIMGFVDARSGKAFAVRDLVLEALNIDPGIELTEY